MRRHVEFESPTNWEEYEEGLKIEGVAITTGTFTGIDGNTITWTSEALDGISGTLLGTPITIGHNGHVAGAVTGRKNEEDSVLYRGIVWDPLGQKMIEEGKGTSVEATVTTAETSDEEEEAYSANVSRIAIVDRPAADGARVLKSTPVELEDESTLEDSKENKTHRTEVSTLDTEQEQLWPEVFDGLKDAGYSEDEARDIIDTLKKFISSTYPGKEEKEEEEETPEFGEIIAEAIKARELWPDVFDGLTDAGYNAAEASKMLEVLKEFIQVPGKAEETEEEVSEEDDETDWEAKYNDLKSELAEKEIENITSKIEEVDENFDAEAFLEDIDDLKVQKIVLEQYKENAERLIDSSGEEVDLSVDDDTKETKLNEISQEIFGKDFDDLSIAGE